MDLIRVLTLFIAGTMKSTDHRRNTRAIQFPSNKPGCPSHSLLWIAFVLYYIAVSSESVDGYKIAESNSSSVLLDGRVELHCITNTSRPLEWYFAPNDSDISEFINGSSDSDAYRIVSEGLGHSTLIIDHVLLTHAGRYECQDIDKADYKLSVDVTVVDPSAICVRNPKSSSTVCSVPFAGKAPDFKWSKSEYTTLCNESGKDSSAIGSLHIKDNKSPARRWRCKPQEGVEYSHETRFSPLNYAVVAKENIRLYCSKQNDDTGYWFRNAYLSANEILIYHRKVTRNGLFSVDESVPGRSDLLFSSSKRTSGTYGCDSAYATYTAEVIVTDPQPSCSWETISGVVNASCSIGFSGNWPPVIYWTDAQGAREANGTIIIPSLRVTSSLIIPLPGKPHEVFFVTCSVKFRIEDKPQTTTAENTPEIFLDPCKVTIEAPAESGPAAGSTGVPKFNSAMIFASVDEYAQTESRYRIALLGERVELDCFGNTSRPLEWYFTLYGSNESEFINGSSQTDDANVTDAYRIVNDDLGHSTLIIGNVLLTHAGRYECRDVDNDYKLFVEVTVLDPSPICDHQNIESSSIVCPFYHAGTMALDFEWLTSENASFCEEFGKDSLTVGSLRLKDYMSPARRSRCEPKEDGRKSRGERFRPLNHVAVIGDKIRLNCTTLNEDTRYWFRNAPLSADKELLYHKRRTIHSWFSVDQTIPGRCDLLFSSRKIASGRYGCDSDDGTHSAEVIVSDPEPICSSETKRGVVSANCSFGFSGNWPPVIEWTDANGKLDAINTVTLPNHGVTSFLNVQLSGDPLQLYVVRCTVKFRIEDKPKETTAINIPEINPNFCRVTIGSSGYAKGADETDLSRNETSTAEAGEAAGAIDVGPAQNIDSGPAADKKGAPKGNEGMAEVDNHSTGSGRESLVLLQVFFAVVAAFVGLGQV